MNWMTRDSRESKPPGERLAELWQRPGILCIPGAHHALAAMLAKNAGFEALYISGAAITASMGLPDLGMLGLEELCFFTRTIFRAADLPLVVDADTGFGGTLNVMRAVRELEDAGAAAIQIEDQVQAKKCGHLDDKQLVAADEMAARVAAARRSRRHARIIARTDAAAAEGLDSAIARAQRYLEAGADAIFPEALTDAEMFRRFAREVRAPLLANMTEFGRTPYFTAREFEHFGFRMVIWPVSALRVAAKAIENLYSTIRQEGSAVSLLDRMQTRAELYQTIGYDEYGALDASIAASIVSRNPPRER